MRICIITPSHLSANPRVVKEASALSDAGHAVSVIHGRSSGWGRDHDQALSDQRWTTRAVAFGPYETSRSDYLTQTVRRRAARLLIHFGSRNASILESAHSPIVPGLVNAALAVTADLYIAHYVSALPAVARAARKSGAVYAFDAEDFHLGDLPDGAEHDLEKTIIRAIEGKYLPGAAYITAASPMIADAYADTYELRPPEVVLNVFPRSSAPKTWTQRGSAMPAPSIYWFSQTVGNDRGLETAVQALALAASGPHLFLRGKPVPGYQEQLRELGATCGVSDKLHFLEPAAPSMLERIGANFDIGFVGELAWTRNRQIALTNKLFSYLSSGIPILASDIPAHRAIEPLLDNTMTLFPVGAAAALAAAMDAILGNPSALSSMRERAWRLGQNQYCWEIEQKTLIRTVDQVRATLSSGRAQHNASHSEAGS